MAPKQMSAYPIKFGKYLLLERVNVGGMAEVFKAKTFGVAGFERILAIKRILPSLIEDEDFVKMFIDEARIAVQLNHANIVQIYELGKHGEHYYIAMEYLPSRDLRSILDKMRMNGQLMSIPQAAYSISKVCEGLDYAHRRRDPSGQPMNIVHRDVSPQNVLVSYEGEIKIIDFGIAKAANRASKTQAGVLKGKFGYMSPEQVRGLPVDRRSDIFAVGVLLYETLTGERLFVGESDFSTLERVRNADVPPPTLYNKKISPELEQIVLKSLAREVEDRYQWASEFAEDLQRFLIEERSIYSAKRLAAYMKESYADDIAAERKKMEEFLNVGSDHVDGAEPAAPPPVVKAPPPPAPGPYTAAGMALNDSDEASEMASEDKTFVIEASAAGLSLVGKNAAGGAKPPQAPENTNDDFLSGASLYGEDDMLSDVDDARTMVSFSNPFDEGAPGDLDHELPPAPAAPSVALDDGESARTRPARGTSKSGPMARIKDENSAPRTATPPRGPSGPSADASSEDEAFVVNPGAPTLQMPAVDIEDGVDVARPALALSAPLDKAVDVPLAAAPPLSPQVRKAIFAGLAVSVVIVLVLTVVVFATGSGHSDGGEIAQAVLTSSGETPASMQIFVDGVQVATTLPAALPLSPDAPHLVSVKAEGFESFEMAIPPLGQGAMQPISVALRRDASGAVVAVASAPKDAVEAKPGSVDTPADDTEKKSGEPKPGSAAKDKDKSPPTPPTGEKSPPGDASAEAKPGAEPVPTDLAIAPSADGQKVAGDGQAWRLSFATIERTERRPLKGAEVLRDGVLIGRTPFEQEFPLDLSKVVLRIKAEGFVAKDVEFARGDDTVVGPATIALSTVSSVGEGEAKAPPSDGEGAAPQESADPAQRTADGDAKEPTPTNKVASNAAAGSDEKAPAKGAARSDDAAGPDDKKPAKATGETTTGSDEPKKASTKSSAASSKKDDKKDDKKEPERRSEPERKPEKKSAPEKPAKTSDPKKDEAKTATLAIGTRPPAEIFIDKKPFGMAPLMGPKAPTVSVGKHFVVLKEPKSGKKVMLEVNIQKADTKAKIIYRFDDDGIDAQGVTVTKK